MTYDPYADDSQPTDSKADSDVYGPLTSPEGNDARPAHSGPELDTPQPDYAPPRPQPVYPEPAAQPLHDHAVQADYAVPAPEPVYGQPFTAPQTGYAAPGYGHPYPTPGLAPRGYSPYGQPVYTAYGQPMPIYDDPNSPFGPLRGASPVEAFKRFWSRGATFKGRASLAEYWWMVGWNGLITTGLATLIMVAPSAPGGLLTLALIGYLMASFIPTLAVGARRLHDSNQSGWLQLLLLVPYLGPFILLVLMLASPRPEGARYDY